MLSPAKSPPSRIDPRQKAIDEKLLAEIDPDGRLDPQTRTRRLLDARREYFRSLARKRIESQDGELNLLIKLVAAAVIRQAKRMMAAQEGGGDGRG